jgi:hypothetical protein
MIVIGPGVGEWHRFKSEHDMVEWVRNSVVPKVLSR